MIDLPIGELLDDRICTLWLARHLHPDGLTGPHCRHSARRLSRAQGQFPAYRCRGCDGYDTLLTGPVFANTRQRPATLGLVLRGMATGAPTARLARELGRSRKQLHTLRQRLPTTRNGAAPTDVMTGTACEADELDQHAGGETSMPHADPTDPPRRRAPKRRGPGTYANARPPIRSVISREPGEPRFGGCDHADTCTCHNLMAENVPVGRTILDTDAWQGDHGSHPARAWARGDGGDGVREVPCNTCEGGGAALRTYLRALRGGHKRYLHLYVATYEAMITTKRVTPHLIRRMCLADRSAHTGYT